jgi:hypothetical protein
MHAHRLQEQERAAVDTFFPFFLPEPEGVNRFTTEEDDIGVR